MKDFEIETCRFCHKEYNWREANYQKGRVIESQITERDWQTKYKKYFEIGGN